MKDQISIIIKTFERVESLKKLLHSIEKMGLNYPVLIADDSKISNETLIKDAFPKMNILYLPLPFDSGLSQGRNVLINHLKTPYFVLCDDDFVFDERADFEKAFNVLITNKLDVLGGDFYNYVTISGLRRLLKLILKQPLDLKRYIFNQFKTSRYLGNFNVIDSQNCELLITNKKPENELIFCDMVNNFFLASTHSVKSIGGWDPELKLGEHEDFFLRAKKNNLKVAYLTDFGVKHYPVISSNYKKYRLRSAEFKRLYIKKSGFSKYREVFVDTGEILFEL